MILNKLYEAIDGFWQWISSKVFVRFEFNLPVEELRKIDSNGKLVFASTYGGFLEWLILTSWCRKQGFNAILVSNRLGILMFAKPLYFLQVLFRSRSYADLILKHPTGPRIIFCPGSERKKLFEPTDVESFLAELYQKAGQSVPPIDVQIVPIFICWRKHARGSRRQLGEYFFGLSSNPNWIGKIWYLARKRGDSTVRSLAPIPLSSQSTVADSQEGTDSLDDNEAARSARVTRRRILVAVNQEMRVVLGPRYFSPYSVKETLMRDPDILKAIETVSETERIDRKKVMAIAYQNLSEIASNYKFRFIEVMFVLLSWLFNKVFDGMVTNKEDLQAVREVMKNKPVVFVSCHRSHLDYLVVPYVMFLEDMVTPHVVAGVNLAFWPVGIFLRMGGAFFIRRSFRGDLLYSVCLRKYLEFLIKSRVNVKFFIEGTRSRTGKMLPPAYGILKMVLETYQNRVIDDIALVPVSICYDEVLEEHSYTKELTGAQKEKESAKGLLKSRKLVKRNIGKVYVRFAPPLLVKEIYQNAETHGFDSTLTLQKTAFQICKSINDVTPVTAKSIICSVLLCHEKKTLSLDTILGASELLADYVSFSGIDLSVGDEVSFRRVAEQTLRHMAQSGSVVISGDNPLSYSIEEKRRLSLNFYKNNGIHCLVLPSIAALAYVAEFSKGEDRTGPELIDAMVKRSLDLRNLLKFEFFFSPTPVFTNEILKSLGFLAPNLKTRSKGSGDGVKWLKERVLAPGDLSVLMRLTGENIESYLTAIQFIRESGKCQMDQKTLIQRVLKFSDSKREHHELCFPESGSTQNFQTAIKLLENIGAVSLVKSADKIQVSVEDWSEELEALTGELSEWLRLMHVDVTKALTEN